MASLIDSAWIGGKVVPFTDLEKVEKDGNNCVQVWTSCAYAAWEVASRRQEEYNKYTDLEIPGITQAKYINFEVVKMQEITETMAVDQFAPEKFVEEEKG